MLLLPRSFSIPTPQCAALPCFFFYSLFNGIRSSTAAVAVMHIRVSLHTRPTFAVESCRLPLHYIYCIIRVRTKE